MLRRDGVTGLCWPYLRRRHRMYGPIAVCFRWGKPQYGSPHRQRDRLFNLQE